MKAIVLIHNDAAVARLDESPEDAGGGIAADDIAGPTAIRRLAGNQGRDQRAGAFG